MRTNRQGSRANVASRGCRIEGNVTLISGRTQPPGVRLSHDGLQARTARGTPSREGRESGFWRLGAGSFRPTGTANSERLPAGSRLLLLPARRFSRPGLGPHSARRGRGEPLRIRGTPWNTGETREKPVGRRRARNAQRNG